MYNVQIKKKFRNIKNGGKISNDDLHHFIHSSYRKGASYKDWYINPSLSDSSVQVYWNGRDAVVVHRGSQDTQDWKENALTAVGIKSGQPRLEHSRKIQKEAEKKYGANNVITIGHSKGAFHAEEVGQNSREIYTLNKPVTPYDLLYKKVPKKQTDIKTTFDPVSVLRPLQQGNEYQNIFSKTLNPLKEHVGSVLNRINPKKMWGKGIMKEGGRCWKGFEPVPGRKPYSKGSCRKVKTGGKPCYNDATIYPQETIQQRFDRHYNNLRLVIRQQHRRNVPFNQQEIIDLNTNIDAIVELLNHNMPRFSHFDLNNLVLIFQSLINNSFTPPGLRDDLENYTNTIRAVATENEEEGKDDISIHFEGAGAGSSVVRNPEFDTLFQEILDVLRGNHTFNDINVKSVQLRITQLLIQITELSNLTRPNLTTTIELIDRIIERPLLEYRFKQKLETIKRILSSALHLQGGRPCYDDNAVVPYEGDIGNELDEDAFRNNPLNIEPREVWSFYKWNNEFRELKNLWDNIFKNYFEDIDIDEDLRMFFNSADELEKNLSGMNMKEEYLKYLRTIKNTHFIKNSHHYLRGIEGIIDNVEKFKGIKTGSGRELISSRGRELGLSYY